MGRQIITLTFMAVGGYLALAYATGFGKDLGAVRDLYTGGVRTLQGR
jgi:hypothetical protein